MNEKTIELIAIGASVTAHCQPCLTYHVERGRQLGLGADEILAAIKVGSEVEKGASKAMRKFSDGLAGVAVSSSSCCSSSDSCCCS
jgi:AhpD family alkylhydroperoxidase